MLSVTKLNEYVSGILSNDPRLRSVRVSGEISGFKRHSSGHLYFNLKDAGAVVPCVMFRSDAAKLKIDPRDGMQAVVRGSVSIYVRDGKYQLYVAAMREAGEGELYRSFLLLKQKLEEEGLFENNRELPLMPRCIGIATSESGAALRDIVNIVRRRFPNMNLLLAPCQVQGADAPREIVAAIRALQRFERCDVIIVGRGGGSYEDLYCFNDERVARAIASCRVPVVSAVGHETDFTIADFAADLRAPTPSAAAELCCPVYADTAACVESLLKDLSDRARDRLAAEKRSLVGIMGSSAMANPQHAVQVRRERLKSVLLPVGERASNALSRRRTELSSAVGKLEAFSPNSALARGYALVTDCGGKIIKNVSMLEPGDGVVINMHGGSADATVGTVRKDKLN